jgi:hypothetical protein
MLVVAPVKSNQGQACSGDHAAVKPGGFVVDSAGDAIEEEMR